jgi:uncharacterized membrane protein YozB (DUF420 family)
MKTIRIFVIIGFLNAVIAFFLSFYLLSKNLENPVRHRVSFPFETFPLYQLMPNGEVQIQLIHIVLAAILLAVPLTLLVWLISRLVKKHLDVQGRI